MLTRITNTYWAPLNICQQEKIPWFLPIYLHLHTSLNYWRNCNPTHLHQVHCWKTANPALPHGGDFSNSGQSHIITFHRLRLVFLIWQEYPPDDSHGNYMDAATISTLLLTARIYQLLMVLLTFIYHVLRPHNFFSFQLRHFSFSG
jgi:GPI-anchor transamidase subunit T